MVPIGQVVLDKKIFNEFPIGSNVKLSSAVVAILVGGRGHWILLLKEDPLRTIPPKFDSN